MVNRHPQAMKRTNILEYRNTMLKRGLSNRTANNHVVDISALFSYAMEQYEDIILKNPCDGITPLPTRSEQHVAYSEAQLTQLIKHLNQFHPDVLFFCRFIAYCFMRPNEIVNMRVRDIDTINWEITIDAENTKVNRRKKKKIPEIFRDNIRNLQLQNYPSHYFVFSLKRKPDLVPLKWNRFGRIFGKVKRKLGFGRNYTMYGIRHSYVCQLLRNGATDQQVMEAGGWDSYQAFQKYKRDIGAINVADLSDKYSLVI